MVMYSVILPVYNVEKYIKRAVESLVNQSYRSFEVILVNDGSTDNSGNICDDYARKYNFVKVLHQKNAGSGKARQNGLNYANGNYVVFVDPDDFLSHNALENNFQLLRDNELDIIINGYFGIEKTISGKTNKKQYINDVNGHLNRRDFINSFSTLNKNYLKPLWNKVYSLDFIRKNNITFSSQRLGQDVLFNYEAFKYAESIYVDHNCYYNYDSTRDGSAVNKYWKDRLEFELNICRSMKKLFDSFDSSENEPLLRQEELQALWYAILVEIRNIHYKGSPYNTNTKRIERIREVSEMKKFKDVFIYLDSSNINSYVSRKCFNFLKRKNYALTQLLISTYVKFKK